MAVKASTYFVSLTVMYTHLYIQGQGQRD